MIVKVFGIGCGSCKKLEQNVDEAVKALGMDIEVKKVKDIQEISSYGIMSVPALMIDDNVVSSGKILSVAEVRELLERKKKSIAAGRIEKAVKDGLRCACDNK